MALLYRQVAADLSVLRQDETARTYAAHVNQLLARAHHIIYSGRKTNLPTLFRFMRDEYPAIFQRQIGYVLASVAVSVAWGILGAVLTVARPEFMRHFVGPQMIATMERHEMWTKSVVSVAPLASSAIMSNNISSALLPSLAASLSAWEPFTSCTEWHDAGRDRRGLPPVRNVAGALEFCRAARVSRIAVDHHRGSGGIPAGPLDAFSWSAALEGVGCSRRS